jgi:glycosyltransferase involved in cell wall biosynthesis
MPKKYILYLSTNNTWGGSEVLWTESARQMEAQGYEVKAAVRYDHELISKHLPGRAQYIDLRQRDRSPALVLRVMQKLRMGKFGPVDIFHQQLRQQKPDLAVISQGNNVDGMPLMKDCIRFGIPFITITHLVTEFFWLSLNDTIINELRSVYRQAIRNYFVSVGTLRLHEKLLADKCGNSAILYNPFIRNTAGASSWQYPPTDVYRVALIGRVETFHKGYDLLIDVLNRDRWKARPIQFSLFGSGPHSETLKRLISQHNISNFIIYEHVNDISEIWKTHHILLMPSRMEGQSLSLIEAMQFNRAAIVTDVGGATELIEEGVNGFIAQYPTADAIDAAMEKAWEQKTLWEQLGLNAGKSIRDKHPGDATLFFNRQLLQILAG